MDDIIRDIKKSKVEEKLVKINSSNCWEPFSSKLAKNPILGHFCYKSDKMDFVLENRSSSFFHL